MSRDRLSVTPLDRIGSETNRQHGHEYWGTAIEPNENVARRVCRYWHPISKPLLQSNGELRC